VEIKFAFAFNLKHREKNLGKSFTRINMSGLLGRKT